MHDKLGRPLFSLSFWEQMYILRSVRTVNKGGNDDDALEDIKLGKWGSVQCWSAARHMLLALSHPPSVCSYFSPCIFVFCVFCADRVSRHCVHVNSGEI